MKLKGFCFVMVFAVSMLGARNCNIFDECDDCGGESTSATGPLPPTLCVPLDCDLLCTGSGALPVRNPACLLTEDDAALTAPEVRAWFQTTMATPCPDVYPAVDVAVHLKPPEEYLCNPYGCTGAFPTDKLPSNCRALCEDPGAPPILLECPDAATNTALQAFIEDLQGICSDAAGFQAYELTPDPSLVDSSVCLRRGPSEGHRPTAPAGPRLGEHRGGRADVEAVEHLPGAGRPAGRLAVDPLSHRLAPPLGDVARGAGGADSDRRRAHRHGEGEQDGDRATHGPQPITPDATLGGSDGR